MVLAGEGADELFGGYRRYDVERLGRRPLTGRPLRHLSKILGGVSGYARRAPTSAVRSWAFWAERDDFLAHSYLLSAEWGAVATSESGGEALEVYRRCWAALGPAAATTAISQNRLHDLTQWLPNVFLEKSDRASMLSGLEVRVPYLDPVVAHSAARSRPTDSRKRPLREALKRIHPNVRLPSRKMGLSVDIRLLMASTGLDEYTRFALEDPASLLHQAGLRNMSQLAQRSRLNQTLAFRLGMVGLWQHEFSIDSV